MQTLSPVLREARRIVIKVGSSLVTNEGRGLDEQAVGQWCRQMATLVREGREIIMVSSGAIAEGMKRLGWARRPHAVHELQAAVVVGQMGLTQNQTGHGYARRDRYAGCQLRPLSRSTRSGYRNGCPSCRIRMEQD